MTIELDEPRAARSPVFRQRLLGQTLRGALINKEQRAVQRKRPDGTTGPDINPKTGKPRQELVLTLLVLDGTTMPAGLGDDEDVPAMGAVVRYIAKGGAFASYIEAMRPLGKAQVGDIIEMTTDTAVTYDQDGNQTGNPVDNDAVNLARSRGKTVGIYGDLAVRRAKPTEADIVSGAELLHAQARQPVELADADDEPF